MSARRSLIPMLLALFAFACTDGGGPLSLDPLAKRGGISGGGNIGSTTIPILQQSPTAPPLETYQVTFWAHVGKETLVSVDYRPAAGKSDGAPFLFFYVPRSGLAAGAGGAVLARGDSVAITMRIDPTRFLVDFQPSGVQFSSGAPAMLGLYYGNANLDLNGNGVVDRTDQRLISRFAVYTSSNASTWSKLQSRNDTTNTVVAGAVGHFSQFAVSW